MQKLAGRSLIYLGATISMRALGILLLPLYSRYLSPSDYGVFGLANTITQLLVMFMSFGMLSAVSRFYFDTPDDEERRIILGNVIIFLTAAPLVVLLMLEWQGDALFHLVTPDVAYSPYLRIVAWGAYLSTFSVVPLMVLRSQEAAWRYAAVSFGQVLFYHTFAVIMVLFLGYGVLGLLWSNLLATALFLPMYIYLTLRMVSLRFSPRRLIDVLRYSLPLIPHSLAGWVLSLSDRVILQHWAPLSDIGIYSLGYTLGSSVQNVADAVNTSWFPSFYRSQSTGVDKEKVLGLATYLLTGVCATALLVTVGTHHFVVWFLPRAYASSERVVFWIAIAAIFIFMYYIWSFSIHYSKKTIFLPLITIVSGSLNVILNVLFVPQYGYISAAINTFIAYAVMALLGCLCAMKLYPVAYEYHRWFLVVVTTLLCASTSYFRPVFSPIIDVLCSIVLLLGWPIVLGLIGFYTKADRSAWSNLVRRVTDLPTRIFVR